MKVRPDEITLHRQSSELEISFAGGPRYRLSYEFLRMHSPSAEVRGLGPEQEVLHVGKQDVDVLGVDPAGSHSIKIMFDDGHDSGLVYMGISPAPGQESGRALAGISSAD